MKNEISIILPSLNPTTKLLEVVSGIRALCKNRIVVVDDGSKAECQSIFKKAAEFENVSILRHAVNQGKGRALKTAFNYCLTTDGDNIIGVVTADADGQHLPADIVHCLSQFQLHPDFLLLGCRCFNGRDIPWKSRLGNKLTIFAVSILGGGKLSDTQTGLRGIPASLMRALMIKATGERFEFETVMLLEYRKLFPQRGYLEIPIETVYVNDNRESHFNPVVDSIKIYRELLRYFISSFLGFIISALFSSVLDQGVFALLYYWILMDLPKYLQPLLISVVMARIISLIFNYSVNKKWVFSKKGSLFEAKSFFSYLVLCVFVLATSYSLLCLALYIWPEANVLFLKILIDTILFLCNYFIQKHWCFS